MEKTEFPNESRLAELRDEGIVPFSRLVTRLGILMALLGLGVSQTNNFIEFRRLSVNLIDNKGQLSEELSSLLNLALRSLILPAAVVLITGIVLGLCQTRFLFRFSALRLDLAKVFPTLDFDLGRILRRVFISILVLGLVLLLSTFSYFYFLATAISPLNNHQSYLLMWPRQVVEHLAPILTGILTVVLILSWILSVLVFRFQHRMSRQELMRSDQER